MAQFISVSIQSARRPDDPPSSRAQRARLACIALLAAALSIPTATALAREAAPSRKLSLPYAPIAGEPGCLAEGRLVLPTAWAAGAPAALVLILRDAPDPRPGTSALPVETAVLEVVAGAGTDCDGRGAVDPRDEMLGALAALVEHGAGPVVLVGFEADAGAALALGAGTPVGLGGDDLIAFCRPQAWAAEPCLCSVETVEVAITPGEFILHMRERRAAGMTSAAELRAAMHHARKVCGSGVAVPRDRLDVLPARAARP